MSTIKVHGGARDGNQPNLCNSCSRGQTMQGDSEGSDKVYCRNIEKFIQIKITRCSGYYDKSQTSLGDFYELAWILETSKNRRSIGFTPWKEYKKSHPDEGSSYPTPY